jgi:translocation and assembly module TamA
MVPAGGRGHHAGTAGCRVKKAHDNNVETMLSPPRRPGVAALLAVVASVLLSACADGTSAPAPSVVVGPASYEVRFQGVDEAPLLDLIRQASLLQTLRAKPPASRAALATRAKADMERLQTVLRSESYYDGEVAYAFEPETEPPLIVVHIETGPAYPLARFAVGYAGGRADAELPKTMRDLDLASDMKARAPAIRDAEQHLLRLLAQRGFPFAAVDDRRIVVDHDKRLLTVDLLVDAGPQISFGAVRIEGAKDVEPDYVRKLLSWRHGERFDQSKVEESLAKLRASNLFAAVDITPVARPPRDGPADILVKVEERPARSIGGGLSWSTTTGILGEAFWEHRNLAGRNETLRLTAKGGELEQNAAANLAKPNLWRRDQTGRLGLEAAREHSDAYKQIRFGATTGLERKIGRYWKASAGVAGEYLDIHENVDDKFLLLSLPLDVTRDTRDNILNPTEGSRIELTLTPSAGTLDREVGFVTLAGSAASYLAFDKDARFVLAGRLGLATILGAARDDIPASKRLYAGGGGSVRGYGYQLLGPLDAGNDPVGGRSRIETSIEMRARITDSVGIVPFIDGGAVGRDSYLDLQQSFRLAAGLGLRYYTGFAPIRLDIAFPLDRRKVDDAFQFYISIGQAF